MLVANAPGSAFLESPALLGFLPALCQRLLDEPLRLPALDTWWCGERAGEVVQTLKTFPELIDPRTNKPLMDRTIIICNTKTVIRLAGFFFWGLRGIYPRHRRDRFGFRKFNHIAVFAFILQPI